MQKRSNRFVDIIVGHLVDILGGRCTITDNTILEEEDEGNREVLTGLMYLYEDLKFQEKNREELIKAEEANKQLKKYNERLQKLNLELEEGRKELEKARADAEEASKAKSRFLSTMSHEIRTPMNAILGFTELLIKEDPQPEQLDNLKPLRYSAKHLLSLINDILDFSEIESEKIEFGKVVFSPTKCLEEILQTFRLSAQDKQIELLFEDHIDSGINIEGDRLRFYQIMTNLVGNAVKFTDDGSIKIISEKTEESESEVALLFRIIDTGVGIAKEKIPHIFDSFYRVSEHLSGIKPGTGLGLAIAKRLTEMQGGCINVKSIEGKGSEFSVLMKYKKALIGGPESDVTHKEQIQKINALKGKKILIVEDNKLNLMLAEKVLGRLGIITDSAGDGRDAVKKTENEKYDAVLMDVQMPLMNGYEATKIIKNKAGAYYRELPIIALTAGAFTEEKERVLASGMSDFVTKPFDFDELIQVLSKHIFGSNKFKTS